MKSKSHSETYWKASNILKNEKSTEKDYLDAIEYLEETIQKEPDFFYAKLELAVAFHRLADSFTHRIPDCPDDLIQELISGIKTSYRKTILYYGNALRLCSDNNKTRGELFFSQHFYILISGLIKLI